MSSPSQPYAVIGDPVSHSLSPELHRLLFNAANTTADYEAVHVKPDELAAFCQNARQQHRPGWNVTLPHKSTIIDLLDSMEPQAYRIGAVNTVKNDFGRLTGYNTDVAGCRLALKRAGYFTGHRAVILGAGGAARAAVAALAGMGVHALTVINPTLHRAKALRDDFTGFGPMQISVHTWNESRISRALDKADLLINATPVGLRPGSNESPMRQDSEFSSSLTVFDMIPRREPTALLRQAAAQGCTTVSGLSMLVGQAMAAQEIWQDVSLPSAIFDTTLNALRKV